MRDCSLWCDMILHFNYIILITCLLCYWENWMLVCSIFDNNWNIIEPIIVVKFWLWLLDQYGLLLANRFVWWRTDFSCTTLCKSTEVFYYVFNLSAKKWLSSHFMVSVKTYVKKLARFCCNFSFVRQRLFGRRNFNLLWKSFRQFC